MNVPARLLAGERLYRDVAYYYGPAGPWIEALGVGLGGRHFAALEAVGLLAAVLLLGSLAVLTARAGSRLAAAAACVWSAAVCIGAPNGGAFLFPYSFGALFAIGGAFLSLAAATGSGTRIRNAIAAAGLVLALTCRPEIGAGAVVLLLFAAARAPAQARGAEFRRAFGIVLTGLAGAAVTWTAALAGVPASGIAPEGPLALLSPPAEWRNVYRAMSGLADPAAGINAAGTALFLDLAILGFAWVCGSAAAARRPRTSAWLACAGVALGVAALVAGPGARVDDALPGLLAPMPVLAVLGTLWLVRRPLDEAARARVFLFGMSAFLGSRVLLGMTYGRITTPYSVQVFPALGACGAVVAFDLFSRERPHPRGARVFLGAVFTGAAILAVARGARYHSILRFPAVATYAGVLRLPADRAGVFAQTMQWLELHARRGDSLAGFPEGGIFNFTLGLPNPLREEQILPGHLDSKTEPDVVRRIETNGPRFLILANQPTAAFGPVAFGRDYAREVWAGVGRHYRLAAAFGAAPPDAPVGDPRFFIRIYERND